MKRDRTRKAPGGGKSEEEGAIRTWLGDLGERDPEFGQEEITGDCGKSWCPQREGGSRNSTVRELRAHRAVEGRPPTPQGEQVSGRKESGAWSRLTTSAGPHTHSLMESQDAGSPLGDARSPLDNLWVPLKSRGSLQKTGEPL
ncbi:lysine-specific demethylase 5C [Platysternon megacephalum]|uniref:Lysine-specific demethylase 5C n=1 Tax=Platysternon megacephalum TaxID=55544 RepID=A0A4D9DTB2_9SAUR|nr:lysine-specific demethylase 5C [Platysternon megacephalum]